MASLLVNNGFHVPAICYYIRPYYLINLDDLMVSDPLRSSMHQQKWRKEAFIFFPDIPYREYKRNKKEYKTKSQMGGGRAVSQIGFLVCLCNINLCALFSGLGDEVGKGDALKLHCSFVGSCRFMM